MQCNAKCRFTGNLDRLPDQLFRLLDRLSDHLASHAVCVQGGEAAGGGLFHAELPPISTAMPQGWDGAAPAPLQGGYGQYGYQPEQQAQQPAAAAVVPKLMMPIAPAGGARKPFAGFGQPDPVRPRTQDPVRPRTLDPVRHGAGAKGYVLGLSSRLRRRLGLGAPGACGF